MPGEDLRADFWVNEYISPWDVYAHGVVRIFTQRRTRYQDMAIVETGAYGKALVLDGKWQSCTGDEFLYHEALVHPAMIQHGSPRKVLILGGGEGATLREVLRWSSVERAVMIDIDGEVVEACREHLPEMHQGAFDDPRVELVIGDALTWIEQTEERWDVIVSDLSDPIEEGPSFRLFTREYFSQLRSLLDDGGILVVQAGPVAPAELKLHARLANTLGAVFTEAHSYSSHVPTYAAPWGFVIAADRPFELRLDPAEVDARLSRDVRGELRLIDGVGLLGLLHTPLHVRRAIAAETEVYTLKEPPKFFGGGHAAP
jgi:spermidine synthase